MFDIEDEIESYAANSVEADRESARRQLARMFPELDEEEFIALEEGRLMRYTLNRVMENMLHLKGPSFSVNRTFGNEVFYIAKEEAYDLLLWVESDDDTPKPDSLIYTAPNEEPIAIDDESVSEIKPKESRPSLGPYSRRSRGVCPTSKYQQCVVIVRDDLSQNKPRQDTIKDLINKFDINKATAESYYSKAKAEMN